MKFSPAERQKLAVMLEQLCVSVEDLLLTGLTTISDTTRQTLNITFQETSRMGLLRLGSTLRFANEELGRFARHDPDFSKKRLAFFLNRAWLLAHGLGRALRDNNDAEFDRLSWMPPAAAVKELKFVVMGVHKKLSTGVASFEFRLRSIEATDSLPIGQRLIWSCLWPIKPGSDLPLDGYLHLPQKQKFAAIEFLSGKTITVQNAAVAVDKSGTGRLSFNEQTTIYFGEAFSDWSRFLSWDCAKAAQRVKTHSVSPLDLDIEIQEEVFLTDWTVHEKKDLDEAQSSFPISQRAAIFNTVVSRGLDGKELADILTSLKDVETSEALFGLMHYERCQLTLQPLTIFKETGPDYLMLSKEKFDKKKLVKALNFT